jgi:Kinesin motor domain.
MLVVEQKDLENGSTKCGKLNLVDLAGSEKVTRDVRRSIRSWRE